MKYFCFLTEMVLMLTTAYWGRCWEREKIMDLGEEGNIPRGIPDIKAKNYERKNLDIL